VSKTLGQLDPRFQGFASLSFLPSRAVLQSIQRWIFPLAELSTICLPFDLSSSIFSSNNLLSLTSHHLFCSSAHFDPVSVTVSSAQFVFFLFFLNLRLLPYPRANMLQNISFLNICGCVAAFLASYSLLVFAGFCQFKGTCCPFLVTTHFQRPPFDVVTKPLLLCIFLSIVSKPKGGPQVACLLVLIYVFIFSFSLVLFLFPFYFSNPHSIAILVVDVYYSYAHG
jgi:hypothetical protein